MIKPKVVLFDMGGVLVRLGPVEDLTGPDLSGQEFWARWLASPWVRAFERGECGLGEFGAGLVEEFALDISAAEMIDRFGRFPQGLFPGAVDLVAGVRHRVATGVLSNTNGLHWEHQDDAEIVQGLFDHQFLSFQMGVVKPDRAIFDQVIEVLNVAPQAVVFIDDNSINVEAAREIGIEAFRADGVTGATQVLTDLGLLNTV